MIERAYYPIDEAAKLMGCTEDDLVHLAAIEKLAIWSMLDQVVRVNSLPEVSDLPDMPDFGAELIYGEAGEFLSPADFIRLGSGFFREIEAGVEAPYINTFKVKGSDGEVFFFGSDQEQPRVRHFLMREDVDEFQSGATSQKPEVRRKRVALIRELEDQWPDIESDLRHADENGLKNAAKLPEHGIWDFNAAVKWAEERGKLSGTTTAQKLDPLEALNRLCIVKRRS